RRRRGHQAEQRPQVQLRGDEGAQELVALARGCGLVLSRRLLQECLYGAALDLARVDELLGELAGAVVPQRWRLERAGRVDGLAVVLVTPGAQAIVVLEGEADRVDELVTARADRLGG